MNMQPVRTLLLALLIVGCSSAAAQTYPTKPVRMLVPFPPGGGTDFVARILGQRLTEMWGQQVIVDNRPGASMMIASEMVAKAPPDGYTIIMSSSNHTINPSLYSKIPYDTLGDFAPVTLVGTSPFVLVVHPTLPVKSVKELINLARSRKGQIAYASSGTGGPQQLAGELFKTMANVDLLHVPYKGSGPAEVDLVAGHVQMMFATTVSALPQIQAGRMRALAVTSLKRTTAFSKVMPDLPTVAESGVPGYEAGTWWGVLAPAKTPRPIITKLHGDVVKVLQMPDTRSKLMTQGADPGGNTPEEYAAMLKAEVAQWAKVVKAANIKVD